MKMNKGGINHFRILPPDITTEILSRLPADLSIECRRVCRSWRSVIDHPAFVDHHTRQLISSSFKPKFGNDLIPTSSSGLFLYVEQNYRGFQFVFVEYHDDDEERLVPDFKISRPISNHPFLADYDDVACHFMISSCNGLVFMGPTKPMDMFICNLFTREYVNLGTPTHSMTYEFGYHPSLAYGFGYHPSTNEYKVVRIYYDYFERRKGHVSVYTLGSGIGWRNKGEIPCPLFNIDGQTGLLAYGAIHWHTFYEDDKMIVSFDLADEEFRVVVPLPPPPPPPPPPEYIDQLKVLEGSSCVIIEGIQKDVWILNFNKEVEEFSWNRKFSIPRTYSSCSSEPYTFLKSGKILLSDTSIASYNPKTGAFYKNACVARSFPMTRWTTTSIVPYKKSFVSLKALGEDAKCFGRFVDHALTHSSSSSSSSSNSNNNNNNRGNW